MQVMLKNERQEKNLFLIKSIFVFLFGLMPFALSFEKCIEYTINSYVFRASMWQILMCRGFLLEGMLIKIPLIIRISGGLTIILPIVAVGIFLFHRNFLPTLLFILSSIVPIMIIIFSSLQQNEATKIGINKIEITYSTAFIFMIIFNLLSGMFSVWTKGSEKLAESIFLVFSCVSIGVMIVITIYMIVSGVPAIAEIGLFNFIFGSEWRPSGGIYGIWPLILSSVVGTFGAIIIGVPLGILTAVFLSEVSTNTLARLVRPAVQLLAGIPSVVYGFFGMLVVVPFIRRIFSGKTIGDSLLAVIVILTIMVLPTIISVSETALKAVPRTYKEAALALGTTPTKTIFKVTIPAAKSGILSGVILGVGRAIGETMAVIMVAGNVVNMPSLLGTVRLLTTGIVLEMSYATGFHRQALFAIGLILFVFIMIVNISFSAISKKGVQISEQH